MTSALEARALVVAGGLRGTALLDRLTAVPFCDRDAWVDVLLGTEAIPEDAPDLPRGAVPYLPCGVDEILALVRDVPIRADDDVVDLGSGLGRVAMLVHLLAGPRARGIEIQEHLVQAARERCSALALHDVSFAHANAAETDLDGSVFFLYTPFNGAMLAAVLRSLEAVARRRSIVIGAVGVPLHGQGWLSPKASSCPSLSLYVSREGDPART